MTFVTKTFLVDSPETRKELRYSLANTHFGLLAFTDSGNRFKVTFADIFEFQAWQQVYKAWFDKAPVEVE